MQMERNKQVHLCILRETDPVIRMRIILPWRLIHTKAIMAQLDGRNERVLHAVSKIKGFIKD